MDDVKRSSVLQDNRMFEVTSQDIEPYLEQNRRQRNDAPEINKYRDDLAGMTHAGSIPSVLVEQMIYGQCCPEGQKYNVLSDDPDEARRALVHIQSNHKDCLTVKGNPFARKRVKWQ